MIVTPGNDLDQAVCQTCDGTGHALVCVVYDQECDPERTCWMDCPDCAESAK